MTIVGVKSFISTQASSARGLTLLRNAKRRSIKPASEVTSQTIRKVRQSSGTT
jgi:hypothetical protein